MVNKLLKPTQKDQVQPFDTIVVSGRIGIVDDALIRYLEKLANMTNQLLIHVPESIYTEIVPQHHIQEFLAVLSMVDGILKTQSEIENTIASPNTMYVHLPEQQLQQFSLERIAKKVRIRKKIVQEGNDKVIALDSLRNNNPPNSSKTKIGLITGVFDLIHLGHVWLINTAKEFADITVVAIMSDASINKLEKNVLGDRPIYSEAERIKVLSSLRTVDHLVVFDSINCKTVIRAIKPKFFMKHEKDMSRQIVTEECKLAESLGGKTIITTDNVGYSSTDIICYIRNKWQKKKLVI